MGAGRTNEPENKETNDDALGLTSQKQHRPTLCVNERMEEKDSPAFHIALMHRCQLFFMKSWTSQKRADIDYGQKQQYLSI